MIEFLKTFILIFFAEMGDKTQFLALSFSTKYKAREVIFGVFLGVLLNHGLAVIFADYISNYIDQTLLRIIASMVFLIFGIFSFKLDYEDSEEDNLKTNCLGPVFTVASAFFLGELGDKTQLTAMSLALSSNSYLAIVLGTSFGMVAVSSIGIIVGKYLGKRIPELTMKFISGFIFIFFGFSSLISLNRNNQLDFKVTVLASLITVILTMIIISINIRNRENFRADKLKLALLKCRECECHDDLCPIAYDINMASAKFIGQDLKYIGNIVKYLEQLSLENSNKKARINRIIRDLNKENKND